MQQYITYHGRKIHLDGATHLEAKDILDKHHGRFKQTNPRNNKIENMRISKLQKFKKKKFGMIGKSPSDKRSVSRIINHNN